MVPLGPASNAPHQGQPVRSAGVSVRDARAAVLMLHGRGARAEDILTLAEPLALPGFAFLAPQANGNTWYPNRFLEPIESNEPWLGSALHFVGEVFEQILASGVPAEHVVLLGFSQGACLALEFAARNARRYGGLVGLSGGLIGPDDTPRQYGGRFDGTPVFLGCSESDPHVPRTRVEESAAVLRGLGGGVTERFYSDLGHAVNQDEMDFVRIMMQSMLDAADSKPGSRAKAAA